MAFYQKIAANTLYQLVARIFSSGVSFLITIFVARHFGIASYGDFAKVTSFVGLFYLLADFGFNAIFLQIDGAHRKFRDLFYMRALLGVGLMVLVSILGIILPYNPFTHVGFSPLVRLAIVIFSFSIFTEALLYTATAVFQQKLLYARLMVATIVGSLVTLVSVIVVSLLGLPLLWIFGGFLLGSVAEALIALVFTEEKLFPAAIDMQFARQLIHDTFPVALMLIFNLIYFRIDMFLLALFTSSTNVGIYNIAYSVFDFLIALPLFLSNVLYPRLLLDEKNNRTVASKLSLYVGGFILLGILVAIPFWFGSPLLFSIIKPDLLPAVVPLRILLLSLPIFFGTSILQWILLSKKKQRYLAILYLALTLINIVLNSIYIPHFGYVGSAIITDICEAGVLVALWVRMRQL